MKKDWEVKKLGEVCLIKPPKSEARTKLSMSDFVSFVPMESLGTNQKYFNAVQTRPLKEVEGSYTYFAEEDVLLAKITPCFENGKLGIAKNLENGIGFGSSEYIVFRTPESLYSEYLYYFLSRQQFREEGSKRMSGAVGHKRVAKEFIENILIPLPPLPTQQRIVAILDEAFSAIATAKENAEKNLQNARELFESHLQSVFANPGDGWEVKKLGEILKLDYGKPLPDTKRKPDGMYPVYGANGEKDRTDEYYHDKQSIIVGRKGSAGELNLTENKFWPLDVTYFVTFDDNNYDLNFIFYVLSNLKLTKLAKGVKPGINRNEVYAISTSIPRLFEQRTVAAKLGALSDETNKLETIYQKKLTDLEELKKSILQKAFTGELTEEIG